LERVETVEPPSNYLMGLIDLAGNETGASADGPRRRPLETRPKLRTVQSGVHSHDCGHAPQTGEHGHADDPGLADKRATNSEDQNHPDRRDEASNEQ
jgi:hypothetical protein